MAAAAVANLPCLRTEPELSRLEELKLVDVVFSFNFFVFFLVGGEEFSLAALESVIIVEVLASVPKISCPTCLESRELRLVVDGGETTEAGGGLRLGGYGGGFGNLAHSRLLVGWLHRCGPGGVPFPAVDSGLLLPSKHGSSHCLFLLPSVLSIL